MEKILFTLQEFCEYLGIGQTKARELISKPKNGFAMKIGNKWYIHKDKLNDWLIEQCNKY